MSKNSSGVLRQSAYSDNLVCCLPGCGLEVFIHDPHQGLCFCDNHKHFTKKDVDDFCDKYYTDGEGSGSDSSDEEDNISNDVVPIVAVTASNTTTTTNNNINITNVNAGGTNITNVNAGGTLTNYFNARLPVKHSLAEERKTLKMKT